MIASGLATVQGLLLFALSAGALGLQAWALVDSVRHRPEAYSAAGKLTKTKWVAILGVATAIGVISLGNLMGMLFFDALAVVAAVVYLTDARPALRPYKGRGGGRGTTAGPYGPW
ncbi:uncharacterized protein DUF2516 [Kineococcus xinjiangensis]|uniref:Uncharacterized protein DUF2516 n=1 Tax=Kineococcus xinjiangensis TaxID=512762 RepID=A0A2S6ID04_9ACTN|nr:DUF2516 family protein [Kineococcus xinjiangensis]PPK92053.1 uncharacterized protein DUF2516 [Kineococcus xinjiangensis]